MRFPRKKTPEEIEQLKQEDEKLYPRIRVLIDRLDFSNILCNSNDDTNNSNDNNKEQSPKQQNHDES